MTGSSRLAGAALAASLAAATPLPAQATGPASPPGLPAVPVTKVLAIGRITAYWKPEAIRSVMPREVRETVALYLKGKVEQWLVRTDQPGVVFVFNATDVGEVHDLLESPPLGREKLMEFDLMPLGPLAPLGLLLRSGEHPVRCRASSLKCQPAVETIGEDPKTVIPPPMRHPHERTLIHVVASDRNGAVSGTSAFGCKAEKADIDELISQR